MSSDGTIICSDIKNQKEVNIPYGFTGIDVGAFYECSSLTNITIPNSDTSIGGGAFWKCTHHLQKLMFQVFSKALKTFFLKIVNWKSKYSIIKI